MPHGGASFAPGFERIQFGCLNNYMQNVLEKKIEVQARCQILSIFGCKHFVFLSRPETQCNRISTRPAAWDWIATSQTGQWMNDAFQTVPRRDRTEPCLHKFTRYMQAFLSSLFITPRVRRQEARAIVEMVTPPPSVQSFLTCQSFVFTVWDMTKTFTLLYVISYCQRACFVTFAYCKRSGPTSEQLWILSRRGNKAIYVKFANVWLKVDSCNLRWQTWDDAVHYTVFYSVRQHNCINGGDHNPVKSSYAVNAECRLLRPLFRITV